MNHDILTPENITKEQLYTLLDAAYLDVSIDDDGDVMVREGVTCWVMPGGEPCERVRFMVQFRCLPEASRTDRLECANRINREYLFVRASVSNNNEAIQFDYDLLLAGGVTRRAFVRALKRFCTIPRQAVAEHGAGVVA